MENVNNMEEIRRKTNLISKINDRAEELGIIVDSRLNHFMDIDYATQVFNIDLDAWLDSADTDFMHDYVGIYRNIDRDAISLKHAASQNDFGTFVPRFARNDDADDEILCPECGYSLARNDEKEELRPKHCPECGTKLIY